MVVAAQVGQGAGHPVHEAVERANAIKSFVFFSIKDADMWKIPHPRIKPPSEGKMGMIVLDKGFGVKQSIILKAVIKGQTADCLKENPELIEATFKQCAFDGSTACLRELYQAWANCTLNFYLGEINQSGYLATIACDTCMNTQLGGGTGTNALLNVIGGGDVDCEDVCGNQSKFTGCMEKCQDTYTKDDNTCREQEISCVQAARTIRDNCIDNNVPPPDTNCLDQALADYNTAHNACLQAEQTCLGNANTPEQELACLDATIACDGAAIDTYTVAKTACEQDRNDEASTCNADYNTAIALCAAQLEYCREPLIGNSNECEEGCTEILDSCIKDCADAKDTASTRGEKLKNSASTRDGMLHQGGTNTPASNPSPAEIDGGF